LHAEAYRMGERLGQADDARFSRGCRIETRWALGYWDEAGRAADAFITECASSPHYLETLAREVRAKIRIGRGDLEGALDDSTRSLKLGRQIKDPQSLLPCLLQCSRCYALLGRIDEAHAFAAEAIQLV